MEGLMFVSRYKEERSEKNDCQVTLHFPLNQWPWYQLSIVCMYSVLVCFKFSQPVMSRLSHESKVLPSCPSILPSSSPCPLRLVSIQISFTSFVVPLLPLLLESSQIKRVFPGQLFTYEVASFTETLFQETSPSYRSDWVESLQSNDSHEYSPTPQFKKHFQFLALSFHP